MGSPSVLPSVREARLARDGHGHRFTSTSLTPARQRLHQALGIGLAPSTIQAPVLPLPLANATADVTVYPDRSPLDVWSAVEDLWVRLAAALPVHVDSVGPAWRLTVKGFRQTQSERMQELRLHVLDADLFTWRLEGRRGAFVQLVEYQGDDLVFNLPTLAMIERWPQGDDLGWQVCGLLARLRAQGRASLAGATP